MPLALVFVICYVFDTRFTFFIKSKERRYTANDRNNASGNIVTNRSTTRVPNSVLVSVVIIKPQRFGSSCIIK